MESIIKIRKAHPIIALVFAIVNLAFFVLYIIVMAKTLQSSFSSFPYSSLSSAMPVETQPIDWVLSGVSLITVVFQFATMIDLYLTAKSVLDAEESQGR
jgi:hypothetical protein